MSHLQTALNVYWSHRAAPYDDYQNRPERRDLDRAAWTKIWTRTMPAGPMQVLDLGTGSRYLARLVDDLGGRRSQGARSTIPAMEGHPDDQLNGALAPQRQTSGGWPTSPTCHPWSDSSTSRS